MTLWKYYKRQIFWTLWGGFCLRFVRSCRLFRSKIDESNIDIEMGFVRLERINMDVDRMKKRRLKIEKYLNRTKGDCA
jgi:hypothetical protein